MIGTVEYRPLNADLREAAATFAARIPERDRGFADRYLLYDVAVTGWTQATPARRIAAVHESEIVGLCTVEPRRGWMDHVGELRIIVLPEARRSGIGGELIRRGVELAGSLGLGKLSVEVMASNEGGIDLFERHGFDREATLRRHVRDGEGALQDLVLLALEIPPAS